MELNRLTRCLKLRNILDLFWWPVSIIFFSPQFGIHLQLHIVKINLSVHIFHVFLSNTIVAKSTPSMIATHSRPEDLLPLQINNNSLAVKISMLRNSGKLEQVQENI